MRDTERRERIKYALREADMAAVVCALPTQVLLLSGYWPVVGTPFQLEPGQLIFDDPREAAIGMPMDRDAGA